VYSAVYIEPITETYLSYLELVYLLMIDRLNSVNWPELALRRSPDYKQASWLIDLHVEIWPGMTGIPAHGTAVGRVARRAEERGVRRQK